MSTTTATITGTDIFQPAPSASAMEHELPATSAKDKLAKRRDKSGHVFPTHSSTRSSCLSHDAEKSPSFVGFRNLMVLVLIVSNLRLMIENFRKYGVLSCIRCHDYRRQDVIYGLLLYLSVPCQLFIAYLLELVAARQAKKSLARLKRAGDEGNTPEEQDKARRAGREQALRTFESTWTNLAFYHGLLATFGLFVASYIVYYYIHHPGIGTLCELHAVIIFMKCASYAFTNRELRFAYLHPDEAAPLPELYSSCPYPQNISWANLCYFWWAPTLVYQPVYPRTTDIRWGFVLRHVLEVICLSIVIWIASAQYAAPLLRNSMDGLSTFELVSIAERVMKLSTISLFCWLCGFFALF